MSATNSDPLSSILFYMIGENCLPKAGFCSRMHYGMNTHMRNNEQM